MTIEADVAIVGAGVSGAIVARAVLGAGARVALIERGGLKPHAAQLKDRQWRTDAAGAQPSHEIADGFRDYPWDYVFGVGGSTLHWSGATPRFSADDFRMRSTYGLMEDWPFGLDDLLPHYREAERLLGVAGAPDAAQMPPHPFSPVDRLLEPLLEPYVPFPQARPTELVGKRPPCCGSGVCGLCPVDSRFSVLNTFGDVLEHPRVELLTDTAVERIVRRGDTHSLACVRAGRPREEVRASVVVVAAGGFESPALLVRSGLERPDTGRYLFDHEHRTLHVRIRREFDAGVGASLTTGATDRFRDGPWRREAAAAYVSPFNPGLPPRPPAADAILAGRSAREAFREQWRRTVVLDVLLDDAPRADRRVTLSSRKDALGLPRARVAYGPPSAYEDRGFARARKEIERLLAPLGVEAVEVLEGPAGAHLLGTCRIGGVVDEDLRHLDAEGLYVTGGAVFPTYSPVHPTLTISALAVRLGAKLARDRAWR